MTSHVLTTRSAPSVSSGSRGCPPVATMTTSGWSAADHRGVGDNPETQVDPGVPALRRQPIDDPDEVGPARRRPCREHDLPSRLRRGLQQHDRMSALGRDPRRLQPGRPAPTTTTRRAGPAERGVRCGIVSSRPVAGFWMHSESRPRYSRLMHIDAPTHGRIRSLSPASSLRTMCGSAMWARIIPTMSTSPSAIAYRAVATSAIRFAWKIGRFDALAEPPGELECRPERRPHARG